MNKTNMTLVQDIRKFNRFYTNILGLLDRKMLDSRFSLAEARVLFDIGHRPDCTASRLEEELRMDRGYLSRIIKQFEKDGLVNRVKSSEDARVYYLHLTDRGKDTLSELDRLSNGDIRHMLEPLPGYEQNIVVESMKTIEATLAERSGPVAEKIKIRRDLRPGDAGWLIHLHGWIYAEECGYNHEFEGYVCKTLYDFLGNYSPEKDRIWFAEWAGKTIGAIAIVGHTAVRAQLRWFIIHPAFRGIGFGRKLMKEALEYCGEKGYRNVFLVTTADQKTAIRMYTNSGFVKVKEGKSRIWGKDLAEETYELNKE